MVKIEKEKIGHALARGGDFIVKKYGTDHVIKYSSLSLFLGQKHRRKMLHDYEICEKYIPDFLVKTILVDNTRQYIEIQKYIEGEKLSQKHFLDNKVRNQFLMLVKALENMRKFEIIPIDLIGTSGVLRQNLSNIIVDHENNLKLIDANLLESRSLGFFGFLFCPFMFLARFLQGRIIKKMLRLANLE